MKNPTQVEKTSTYYNFKFTLHGTQNFSCVLYIGTTILYNSYIRINFETWDAHYAHNNTVIIRLGYYKHTDLKNIINIEKYFQVAYLVVQCSCSTTQQVQSTQCRMIASTTAFHTIIFLRELHGCTVLNQTHSVLSIKNMCSGHTRTIQEFV